MITALRKLLASPFVTMWLVVLMYIVKAMIKISLGGQINSPMIAGDGYHNLADIIEALAVLAVIYLARRPATNDYPFGRKNIEFFTSLAIGLVLLLLALDFALKSLVGLISYAPTLDQTLRSFLPLPEHHPLVMDDGTFVWVLCITAGSAVLSMIVSRYQIAVGKATGHASLVADGEETASDGRIEILALIGVLGEYFLNSPWLEYPLGLVVAGFIAHTGWGLFRSGYRVLLQHSIGEAHEKNIRQRCMNVCGVHSVEDLKTFQVGQMAVCMLVVTTKHTADTVTYIKYGIEHHVREYLLSGDFKECEIHIKFQRPDQQRHRVAYAIAYKDKRFRIAGSLNEATHILVCDVEMGMIVRTRRESKPEQLGAFLARKRILKLYFFTGSLDAIEGTPANPIPEAVPGFQPRLFGLS
ncbi:MAG: cation diffusion facilitator family transporter [Candidatus Obscuribacterales bacterium]|nr:cation diffusion facilitator family transporter [Candidatus Obscuribacterales bacterium]